MEISKVANEFNAYKVALSYGELEAIRDALRNNHSGVVADEAYNALNWYLDRVPEPGSEDTKLKELDKDEDEGEDEGEGKNKTGADAHLEDPLVHDQDDGVDHTEVDTREDEGEGEDEGMLAPAQDRAAAEAPATFSVDADKYLPAP